MPRVVYVQTVGNERPARVLADSVEERTSSAQPESMLVLKQGDLEVGRFKLDKVIGWWFHDEI
jgi:hypothetical protein